MNLDKIHELEMMDKLLQQLYERVEQNGPLNESRGDIKQQEENEKLTQMNIISEKKYLEKLVNRGHARRSTIKQSHYYISEEGLDFIKSNRSYVKDHIQAINIEKKKNVLIKFIAIMLAIISLILSYIVYQKHNEAEEGKTRIEEVTIENGEKNKSKLKQPVKN